MVLTAINQRQKNNFHHFSRSASAKFAVVPQCKDYSKSTTSNDNWITVCFDVVEAALGPATIS